MTEYNMNAQKSIAFMYTNNKSKENETRKTIPITITSKNIKYLGINLSREAKDLYNKNYIALRKEIEKNSIKCKGIPCSWIFRIIIVKIKGQLSF